MKKSVLKVYESKESILRHGNHGVSIKPRPLPVRIIDDKTLESVEFTATRVFYFFDYPICVVNDNEHTFRLSHAGIYATDKKTGETKEGEWPKTTTQTLMMYRDLCCGDGYTEIEPIEGRPARDWKTHMEQYQKEKEMRKAGIIPPRKTRTKKAKINEAMLELLEKEFGLSREQVLAKMAEKAEPAAPNLPAIIPAEKLTVTNVDYIGGRPVWVLLDIMRDVLSQPHEHADADWWESELATKELQDEAKEIGKKNPSKKTKKATAKTAKKSLGAKVAKNAKKVTAKTTTKKATTKTKKEAVA